MSHKEINKVNEMISAYFGFHPHDVYRMFAPKQKSGQYYLYRDFMFFTLYKTGLPSDALARRYGWSEHSVRTSLSKMSVTATTVKCLQKKFDEIYQNIYNFEG